MVVVSVIIYQSYVEIVDLCGIDLLEEKTSISESYVDCEVMEFKQKVSSLAGSTGVVDPL